MALNYDGSVAVGFSQYGTWNVAAFRWSGGNMRNLGTLGWTAAWSYAVNNDGSVVVGASTINSVPYLNAFRWTAATGMVNLGTLGGTESVAHGISADGSVIAGYSDIAGDAAIHAFRWTAATGMVDIGSLGGTNTKLYGLSSDGLVGTGAGYIAGDAVKHAFRWTAATGMVDLGTLGGLNSEGYRINGDGSVIVGDSYIAGNASYHAFRWTNAGVSDLKTLGGTWSSALDVSANGAIVVGWSYLAGDSVSHAFRWTQASGMQDLNTLLTNAGVNLNGFVLGGAQSISGNGQFIAGQSPTMGPGYGWIVRYYDGTPVPIAGLTNVASVQNSINDLATSRRGAGVQQQGFAAPLLGGDKPVTQTSDVGAFGAVGSASAGVAARYAFSGGVMVLGGVSYSKEEYDNVELRHATTGALALRYTYDGLGSWKPFVEGGGWVSPNAALTFSRTYANGAGTAMGTGTTSSDIIYAYGRAGMAVDIDRANQIAISAEYGRERMRINGYSEAMSSANPFEAEVPGSMDSFDVMKLKGQYTLGVTRQIDATVWLAAAKSFGQTVGLTAVVDGVGMLTPSTPSGTTWAEFGGRVGYKLTDSMTFDVFSGGIAGRNAIGTQVHSGVGLRVQF